MDLQEVLTSGDLLKNLPLNFSVRLAICIQGGGEAKILPFWTFE